MTLLYIMDSKKDEQIINLFKLHLEKNTNLKINDIEIWYYFFDELYKDTNININIDIISIAFDINIKNVRNLIVDKFIENVDYIQSLDKSNGSKIIMYVS